MRRLVIFIIGAMLLTVVLLFLISCEEKCTCSTPTEHIPDYHILYGPIARCDPPRVNIWVYSTKSGGVIDTITDDIYYADFRFTRDGRLGLFAGKKEGVDCLARTPTVRVMKYPEWDTLTMRDDIGSGGVELDADEKYAIINSTYLTIVTFPGLATVYSENVGKVVVKFLPDGNRVVYMKTGIDSFYVIDFSKQDSIHTDKYPVQHSVLSIYTRKISVDNDKHFLYALTSYIIPDSGLCYFFGVYDTDSLKLRKSTLGHNGTYTDLAQHPDGEHIYLFSNSETGMENRIDIYNVRLNSIEAYLNPGDIFAGMYYQPGQIEFTPNGEDMYILYSNFGWNPMIGVHLSDKSLISYFEGNWIQMIRINPIDWAQ